MTLTFCEIVERHYTKNLFCSNYGDSCTSTSAAFVKCIHIMRVNAVYLLIGHINQDLLFVKKNNHILHLIPPSVTSKNYWLTSFCHSFIFFIPTYRFKFFVWYPKLLVKFWCPILHFESIEQHGYSGYFNKLTKKIQEYMEVNFC